MQRYALVLFLSGLLGIISISAQAAEPPNFVIILADDLGYGDLGCYGGEIPTPHLDALARGGMRFVDFHSNGAVCSPTRAALLTGRYQQRAGIPGVLFANPARPEHRQGLRTEETTFAEALRDTGYATAVYGKWHLGYLPRYNPIRHGFREFRGYVSGNVDYKSHVDGAGRFDWWHGEKLDREDRGYTTHLITRHAVSFIEEHRNGRFCLYVPHEAPHYPYQGPDDPPVRREGEAGQKGTLWNDREPAHMRKAYREMVRELDRGVGEIVETLRRLGLTERTLVGFISDNGATGPGSNGILRGKKGSVWEGGHRVPAIFSWPGRITAGSTNDSLALTMDVFPTLLALADNEAPAERPFDGIDLSGVLLRGATVRDRKVFWQHGRGTAMRDGPWKLVLTGRGAAPLLFDLSRDPGENADLAKEHPERVRAMEKAIGAWRADVAP